MGVKVVVRNWSLSAVRGKVSRGISTDVVTLQIFGSHGRNKLLMWSLGVANCPKSVMIAESQLLLIPDVPYIQTPYNPIKLAPSYSIYIFR